MRGAHALDRRAAHPADLRQDRSVTDLRIAALRQDLTAAGFTVDGLVAAWGPVAAAAIDRGDVEAAIAALDVVGRSAIGTLGRLFVLGESVPEEDAAAALPALGLEAAEAMRLIRRRAGAVLPRAGIRPCAVADEEGVASWWVVADRAAATIDAVLNEDHVLGVAPASMTLAGILVPTGGGTVLDLGTGSGVLALHAARTASRVVATDVSARALDYARLTTALNEMDVELRLGSLYDPVAGERFDRIVSNPPFVVTPRHAAVPAYTYRDAGFAGDGLVKAVVRGVADHLLPGGVAQLLGNWEVHGDETAARERVLGWAGDLDVWIVERDLIDPALYAETWARDGGARAGGETWRTLVRAWLDDFAARGVTAIAAGYVTLRLPSGGAASLRRYERIDGRLGGGVGRAIAEALAAHDAQRALDDDGLAAAVLRVAPDVTEHRAYWPGDADPTVIELVQGGGFARTRRVDTVTAAVVGACDGDLPVGMIAGAVARLLDADPAATRAAVLPVIRELLVEGFLRLP